MLEPSGRQGYIQLGWPRGPRYLGLAKILDWTRRQGPAKESQQPDSDTKKEPPELLGQLKIGKAGIKVRLYKGSILAAALYGHEGVGVSPKRRKWFRGLLAQVLGRPNQASVDATLDMHGNRVEDPWFTIVAQHFKSVRRLLLQWPERDFSRLQQGWERLELWLQEAEHPWKRAAGPLGACWCYLQEPGGVGTYQPAPLENRNSHLRYPQCGGVP